MSERFARNSLFSTLAGLGTALSGFLSMVIVARLLGPGGTGTIAFALWVVSLAVTCADFGIHQTLTRYLPQLTAKGDDTVAWSLAAFLLRPGLILTTLGAAAFIWYGHSSAGEAASDRQLWWIVALLFALQSLTSFGIGLLRGMQRFDRAAKLTLISLLLQLAAVSAGAYWGGIAGALLGYCAGSILPIVAIARLIGRPARIADDLRRRMWRFALFSWAGALTLTLVWSRLEIFFLERYHGMEAVALFTVGLTFAMLAAQGPLLLTGGLLAHFSESHALRDRAYLQSVYATATRVMAFILLPSCFGLAAILPVVLPAVYGSAFAAAVPVAGILVAGAAIGATGSVGSQIIYAQERSDFIFLSGLVGAVLSLAAGFLIVPGYGMLGAALARIAIHAVMFVLGSWFILRRLHLELPFVALAKLVLSALLSAAAAYLCTYAIANPVLAVAAAVTAGAAVYLAVVRGLGALPAHDIARLTSLTRRLPGMARGPVTGLFSLLAPRGT